MAYRAQAGNSVTILHGLQNLAGNGYVSGEAASAWGLTVYDDDRSAQGSITPTVAEIGSTGWYSFAFTVPAGSEGIWSLDGTEPAGAEGSFVYVIDVTTGISASSDRDLTTLARVKERLGFADGDSTYDDVLATLITEVSNEIQEAFGRYFAEGTYTEYYDGTGTEALVLRQGPLVSVTSVNEVEYTDAGDGSRDESLTELEEKDRLEYSLESTGSLAPARIEYIGGVFTKGQKNWKVVYTAGFSTLPEGLVAHATEEVVTAFNTRKTAGLASKVLDEGQLNLLSPKQCYDARVRVFAPYRNWGTAF